MTAPSFASTLGISVRGAYGGVPDGATDCSAAILAAAADAGSQNRPIVLDGGDFWIASDIAIEVPVHFAPGARVSGPPSASFAMQGGVIAGAYQIFYGALQLACYRPTIAYAEWFGAILGRGDLDAAPAINRALTIFPVVQLLPGEYYTNATIEVKSQSLVGSGRNRTRIVNGSATNHIIRAAGVRAAPPILASYIERPTIAKLTGLRAATPITPPNPASDISQGHGLHIDMASNPIVEEVDMTNNLIDFYWANTLSAYWNNSLSLMTSGGISDRRTSFYIDGQAPGGLFPPNLVFRAKEIRQSNQSGAGLTYGMIMRGSFTDHDIERLETANCTESLWLDGSGGNVHIRSAWLDSFKNNGVRIDSNGHGNNVTFLDLYAAPGLSAPGVLATGVCIIANSAENFQFLGTQITAFPGGGENKSGAIFNNSVNCVLQGMVNSHSTGATLNNCYGCSVDISASQFTGTATNVINAINGYANKITVTCIGVSGSVAYKVAVALATTGGCSVDLTRVLDSAVINRLTLDSTVINVAGNITGDNFVIWPGAVIRTAPS